MKISTFVYISKTKDGYEIKFHQNYFLKKLARTSVSRFSHNLIVFDIQYKDIQIVPSCTTLSIMIINLKKNNLYVPLKFISISISIKKFNLEKIRNQITINVFLGC